MHSWEYPSSSQRHRQRASPPTIQTWRRFEKRGWFRGSGRCRECWGAAARLGLGRGLVEVLSKATGDQPSDDASPRWRGHHLIQTSLVGMYLAKASGARCEWGCKDRVRKMTDKGRQRCCRDWVASEMLGDRGQVCIGQMMQTEGGSCRCVVGPVMTSQGQAATAQPSVQQCRTSAAKFKSCDTAVTCQPLLSQDKPQGSTGEHGRPRALCAGRPSIMWEQQPLGRSKS